MLEESGAGKQCEKLNRDREQCLASKRLQSVSWAFFPLIRERNWSLKRESLQIHPSEKLFLWPKGPTEFSMTESPSGSRNVSSHNKGAILQETKAWEIWGNDKCKHKDQEKYKELSRNIMEGSGKHTCMWKYFLESQKLITRNPRQWTNQQPKIPNQ